MKINIGREALLGILQAVVNVVERRQTLPILSNILISAEGEEICVTATDMEVEVVAKGSTKILKSGALTIPGRKLLDICRSLPPLAELNLEAREGKVRVISGRSRFVLSTLPATDYPSIGNSKTDVEFVLHSKVIASLIGNTQFAMAHQDVRFYLNGLLVEIGEGGIKAVATDGHRLALYDHEVDLGVKETRQIIIPRKGVLEVQRLISHFEGDVAVAVSSSLVRFETSNYAVTIKLVDGRFPDYEKVIPKNATKTVTVDREQTKAALHRTSILSNEKFRGVRLSLSKGLLKTAAHNPEQEEAEEEIEVEYEGEPLEIGFNVSYLLDVFGVLESEKVKIELSDSNSSCLIQDPINSQGKFVVMPMRL
jgi:DNA polymerase III subunit beta